MSKYTNKTQCRLCGSKSLTLVLDLGQSPIGEDYILPCHKDKVQPLYPVTLMRCTKCCHLQLGEVVHKDDLYLEYLYETTRSLGLDKHFADYARQLSTLSELPQRTFAVDVGSNTGTLLSAMQAVGFRVMGVEPAQHIAEQAQKNGFPTYCGFFDKQTAQTILQQHGFADIITTNNCFANIDNLDIFMGGVDTLLSPTGYFVIETGYALDLIQNFVIDNIYHEHLSYFLLTPLRKFLQKHGFDVERAERVATKGGAIRVYARRQEMLPTLAWSVQSLMNLECELGFMGAVPFTRFAALAEKRRYALHDMVAKLSRKGHIAAFGAAVGCTALIYWSDIGQYIEYIVDDNVTMQGRFSPGHHIPVFAPDRLYTKKTEYLIVLPWRYYHPLLERHKAFCTQGGIMINSLLDIDNTPRLSR